VKITKCEIDGQLFYIADLCLKTPLTRRILDRAQAENRSPIGMGVLVNEMLEESLDWCKANCSSEYRIDPNFKMEIWFTNPTDAVLFKLTHG